jgi:ankyrin repeat protein
MYSGWLGAPLFASASLAAWTPLSRAAKNGHKGIVELLLATGKVDINSKDLVNQTPLSLATLEGHTAVVRLLQSFSADAIGRQEDGSKRHRW